MATKKGSATKAKKRKPLKRAFNMLLLVASVTKFAEQFIGLIGKRSRQAGQSLFFLLVLAFMFASMVTVVWLSLMGMLFVYLTSQMWTDFGAVSMIAFVNVLLLGLIAYLIHCAKRDLKESVGSGIL